VTLRILFVKLSDQRHRLVLHRAGSGVEQAELETRSYLLHDLVHWAVEAESGIGDGFWGLLANGTTLDALADRTMADPPSSGLALAERLVGPFQSLFAGRLARELYLEQARGTAPFVDGAWIERVLTRLRKLTGAWRAVPFSQALELDWPPSAEPRVVRP
jgi:hypothetical protein